MGILKKMQFVQMLFKQKSSVQQISFEECYHYFFLHMEDFVSALIKESTEKEKVLLEIFKEFIKQRRKRGYDIEESTRQDLYNLAGEKCLEYIQDHPAMNENLAILLQTSTAENIQIYLQDVRIKAEKERKFINTARSLVLSKEMDEKYAKDF